MKFVVISTIEDALVEALKVVGVIREHKVRFYCGFFSCFSERRCTCRYLDLCHGFSPLVCRLGGLCWLGQLFYAGGDKNALMKSIPANIAGMVQGAFFFWFWMNFGGGSLVLLALVVGIFSFLMVMEANISLLSVIPGQFLGVAAFIGNLSGHKSEIVPTLVSSFVCVLIGNFAGIISAKLPELFKKAKKVTA